MTSTIRVVTIVSLRDGQVTLDTSERTCCINCIGLLLAIGFRNSLETVIIETALALPAMVLL
jgi:hypothetical protein